MVIIMFESICVCIHCSVEVAILVSDSCMAIIVTKVIAIILLWSYFAFNLMLWVSALCRPYYNAECPI